MDSVELDKRVDSLVQFLSTRKELQEYHVKTVMEMTRELSKYKHELAETKKGLLDKRNEMNAMLNDDGYIRPRPPHYPNMLQLPEGTRSVEIKL